MSEEIKIKDLLEVIESNTDLIRILKEVLECHQISIETHTVTIAALNNALFDRPKKPVDSEFKL